MPKGFSARTASLVGGTLRVYQPANNDKSQKIVAVFTHEELQHLADLAREMLNCGSYAEHDEHGNYVGPDPELADVVRRFRKAFQLKTLK